MFRKLLLFVHQELSIQFTIAILVPLFEAVFTTLQTLILILLRFPGIINSVTVFALDDIVVKISKYGNLMFFFFFALTLVFNN